LVVHGVESAVNDPWHIIGEQALGDVLIIGDHASNHVPPDIDLGIDRALLSTHIGWDIGVATLAHALGAPLFLGSVSRLVIDLNRELGDPGLVPQLSDGHDIPGNYGDNSDRIGRYWQPYHDELAAQIARTRPRMLVSLHSFTPTLSSVPEENRPWEIGILYNQDDRAARIAIPLLEAASVVVGDQRPYSGKHLNATMNRHGEGTDTPYLGIEVRQDLIGDDAGVAKWSGILRPVIQSCLDHFVAKGRESA
jgi:predicted N-formylglutamate amidohydrolase